MYRIVALGNPGEKYIHTRHNAGKIVLSFLEKAFAINTWKEESKIKADVASGIIGTTKVVFIFPTSMMNNSGKSLVSIIKTKKDRDSMVVLYDDLDLPLGSFKFSYGRSSGGHNGVESIITSLKSKDFLRLRIGVSKATPTGLLKKPKGEKAVIDFILGEFTKGEQETLKLVSKKIEQALSIFVKEGRERAMNQFNS